MTPEEAKRIHAEALAWHSKPGQRAAAMLDLTVDSDDGTYADSLVLDAGGSM